MTQYLGRIEMDGITWPIEAMEIREGKVYFVVHWTNPGRKRDLHFGRYSIYGQDGSLFCHGYLDVEPITAKRGDTICVNVTMQVNGKLTDGLVNRGY